MWIGHRKEIRKQTFRALALRTSFSFSFSVPRGRAPFGQHQESRPLAHGQVQHRKSAIHGLSATLRMFRVKFDKSDWFWSQSIVFTKPFENWMSLDQARGRDSWCWPKGARPLGTRMEEFENDGFTFWKRTFQIRKWWRYHNRNIPCPSLLEHNSKSLMTVAAF